MKSKRKYRSIDINLDNSQFELLLPYEKDRKRYLKKLVKKHATTAKEVSIKIASRRKEIDNIALDYLVLLPNVESATIALTYIQRRDYNLEEQLKNFERISDSDSDFDLNEDQLPPRKKKKRSKKPSEVVLPFRAYFHSNIEFCSLYFLTDY